MRELPRIPKCHTKPTFVPRQCCSARCRIGIYKFCCRWRLEIVWSTSWTEVKDTSSVPKKSKTVVIDRQNFCKLHLRCQDWLCFAKSGQFTNRSGLSFWYSGRGVWQGCGLSLQPSFELLLLDQSFGDLLLLALSPHNIFHIWSLKQRGSMDLKLPCWTKRIEANSTVRDQPLTHPESRAAVSNWKKNALFSCAQSDICLHSYV